MKQVKSTEFVYASARLRALERHIVGRERLSALMDCRTTEEVMARLAEYGIVPESTDASADYAAQSAAREAMLLDILKNAYAEVEAAVPNPAPFRAYRYPYDCNNIKAAIKCAIRGISAKEMLFDFGTVPSSEVEAIVREGKGYDCYPVAMAKAIPAAREAYAATGDPCRIDAILDRACYVDMMATLSGAGCEPLVAWLREKLDLLNILICLRLLRMGRGEAGLDALVDTLLPGGTLDAAFFTAAYHGGEAALWQSIVPTPYTALTRFEGDVPSLQWVERTADDLWMTHVRDAARTPFGPEVVGGYLIGVETSVRNLRILLAAKDAGMSQALLRERIRMSYV